MSSDNLWIEKELSWLSFNERVLQEAMDKSVPLIERVRFLGIFSNNQDEFFKVRVADVKRRVLIHSSHDAFKNARARKRWAQTFRLYRSRSTRNPTQSPRVSG